ncbi:prothymosin alpha-like [Saimiri boliviensis]|uniref:prothymosin alpha-like n=1 Tax=Saimiri boliviensis TaxID=27679 RepID=UPI003D77CC3F
MGARCSSPHLFSLPIASELEEHAVIEAQLQLWHSLQKHLELDGAEDLTQQNATIGIDQHVGRLYDTAEDLVLLVLDALRAPGHSVVDVLAFFLIPCIGSAACPTTSDAAVDTSSEITTKDLKEKKEVVEEAENGRDASANGNEENEENGEQEAGNEVDEEEEEGGEEEEEEEEGDGEEEEDGDEGEETESAAGKRAAKDDEDDDVDTKKQKTDEDD